MSNIDKNDEVQEQTISALLQESVFGNHDKLEAEELELILQTYRSSRELVDLPSITSTKSQYGEQTRPTLLPPSREGVSREGTSREGTSREGTSREGQYKNHFQSAQCYAQRRGYTLIHEQDGNLFGRHLAVKKHLDKFDWIYSIDADVMFVNFDKALEDYIIKAGSADIILPMRIINGEIVAGGYLVRSSDWSRQFLDEWGTKGSKHQFAALRNSAVDNADNGFLIQLLTFKLFVEEETGEVKEKGKECVELFNSEYNRGKCCFSSLMATRRRFKHVWILRRGSGFFRDDFVGSFFFKNDLSVHHKGRWKNEMGPNFFMDGAKQCRNFTGVVLPDLVLSGAFQDRLLCETDYIFAQAGHAGQFNPDIYQCFPNCPDDATNQVHIPTMQQCRYQSNFNPIIQNPCKSINWNVNSHDMELYNIYRRFVADQSMWSLF
eukprot:768482-Hanusia_phi.AAC.1